MLAPKLHPAPSKRIRHTHVDADSMEADAALPAVSGNYRPDLYSSQQSAVNY